MAVFAMTDDVADEYDGNPPDERVWASQWYRITPRSFVQTELFFDPGQVVLVFAGESYKSFLLRRDGREDHAAELGEEYRDRPADAILADDRHEAVPLDRIDEIRIRAGTFLRKPKLVIATADGERGFYHASRRHDVEALATDLATLYPSVRVVLDGEKVETA